MFAGQRHPMPSLRCGAVSVVALQPQRIDDSVAEAEDVVSVLDKGFLALDGAFASDLAVANGARFSFNQSSQVLGERDEGLIRFLMRDHHGSPFEHGYFRFIVK